jgi:DNA repair exonuclease SbcCD ATPase subunit
LVCYMWNLFASHCGALFNQRIAQTAANYGSLLDQNENDSARHGRTYVSSAAVPKEAHILENSSTELQSAAAMCIKAVSECLQSRKTIYLTQLKKIRDTSNMATRNAVQHERSEAAAYMARLKESLDTQRRQEVRACEDKIVELENTVATLRASLESSSAELARLNELEQNRAHLQNTAVAAATEQCRRDHAQDRERLQTSWNAERARLLEDTRAQVENMKRQNEVRHKSRPRWSTVVPATLVNSSMSCWCTA